MTPFSLFLVALFVLVVHGVDLDPKKFTSEVLGDERAWMVEFYSSMCGGCQEFASTWDRIADAFSESSSGGAIKSGKVNIDNSEGMKLAEKLGVLEDGVPHVKLFKSKGDTKGISVVKSDSSLEYVKITNRIIKETNGLHKKGHYYIKK